MANLALLDLVLPYLGRAENLGPTHAALSALRVVTFETATDELGSCLRGHCEVNGYLEFFPSSGTLVAGGVDEAAPAHDPSRSDPIFDLRDTTVDFELFIPRQGSQIASAAQLQLGGPNDLTRALDAWAGTDDYPTTGFVFDLILNAPKLRPPFLHPAKLSAIGVLEPEPNIAEVSLTLPRLRFRVEHGNQLGDQLVLSFVSAGVSDLDDPGSTAVSEMISMDPPYAYIGGPKDRALGFGFRSATLDLDGDWTPPALREKAGVGDDWTGLYLPEVRMFVAPDGLRNLAFECGAQELLIGMDRTGGIWGDFDAALVQQGSGDVRISPRFVAAERAYGITRTSPETAPTQTATAEVPEQTLLVVDVTGGRPPYTRKVTIDGTVQPTAATHAVDLSATGTATVRIEVTPSGGTTPKVMEVQVRRLVPELRVVTPERPGTPQQRPATITSESGFDFDVVNGSGTGLTVVTVPPTPGLRWREGSTTLAGSAAALNTDVPASSSRTFEVTRVGASGSTTRDFFFLFDHPSSGAGAQLNTTAANPRPDDTFSGGGDPMAAYAADFAALPNGATIQIVGDASYENDLGRLDYNVALAWRRAMAVRAAIEARFGSRNFDYDLVPEAANPSPADKQAWALQVGWTSHVAPNDREHWRASVTMTAATPDVGGSVTVTRPATTSTPVPATTEVVDPPPPETSPPPDWFRSAKVLVRVVRSELIALQLDFEVDLNTVTEQRLQSARAAIAAEPGAPTPPATSPEGRPITAGIPENAGDGITAFRVLVQTDPATGRWDTLLSAAADAADTDGLFHFGWISGVDPMPAAKDLPLTFLGSYLSLWPLLAAAPPVDAVESLAEGRESAIVDASLAGAALVAPAVVALLPWFSVERVILFGVEYFHTQRDGGFTGTLLADIEADWSIDLLGIVKIKRDQPLKVRYKAIGLRLTNRDTDPPPPPGATDLTRWDFLPVFDASRGYTIDVASGGGMTIADPLGQILRIVGARLSRSNPMTIDVDIALGVDLGVVSIDQASIRAYLDASPPRLPELTALSASVDIPGALVGRGYVRITTDSSGQQSIAGQLDLTLRPLSLRITAALGISSVTEPGTGREATAVYVGLNVVLPAGIPLGSTGLGIFGFRGIFGMHYRRTEIGAGTGAPALEWLRTSEGQPHLIAAPSPPHAALWEPKLDNWAFGLGMLIGTMEGGVLVNLDGTLLLELPGPRVLIMMNARILVPPPSVDGMGQSGGVLAVIEITPEHFLIGVIIQWEVESLLRIVIPIEAVFPFPPESHRWHVYLGRRSDLGGSPVEVDVLGIVRGTGYLVLKGDGLAAFNNGHAALPPVPGVALGLGLAASFTWGDVDDGLYLRIGGGMDAVLGFDPFLLAGNIWVAGELRLWIVSIGADASLTVKVAEIETTGPGGETTSDLSLYVHGKACGHVDFFFFEVSGCVEITIAGPEQKAAVPTLVQKLSLQARTPGLAQGTAVDRSPDTSLGQAPEGASYPGDGSVPVVPIDAIPVISMNAPASPEGTVTVAGLGVVGPAPGVDPNGWAARAQEKYRYRITGVRLERVKGNGQVDAQTFVPGSAAIPPVWWSSNPADEANAVAQLALLTWQPTPATKAIEVTDKYVEDIKRRWGTVCSSAAPPAEVLWTFKLEPLGPSATGWDLEGVAWPDPPGTRRSTPPPTGLRVTEPWRSGDPALDALRGVIPAVVLGDAVECQRTRPRLDLGDLVRDRLDRELVLERALELPLVLRGGAGPVDGPDDGGELLLHDDAVRALVTPHADSLAVRISPTFHEKATAALPGLRDLAAAAHREPALGSLLDAGSADGLRDLGRVGLDLGLQRLLDLDALIRPPRRGDEQRERPPRRVPGSRCPVKVLQAPIGDNGELTSLPDDQLRKRLAAAEVPTHEDSELVDLVHLHTGEYAALGLMLLLPRVRRLSFVPVVARVLDAKGNELDRVPVTSADLLDNGAALPAAWTDLSGPWGNDVTDLLTWATQRKLAVAYLRVPEQHGSAVVELGRLRDEERPDRPPVWYLAACGMVSGAEVARSDWDTEQIAHDRNRLVRATGPDASSNALLVPGSRYRIVVDWHAERQSDGKTLGSSGSPISQTFWFRTDKVVAGPADQMLGDHLVFDDTPVATPVRLDPWVLMTFPQDNEIDWFHAGHVRLLFNTHDVDRIFAAHGLELRIRIEAANGDHPTDTPTTSLPLTIGGAALKPVKQHLKPAFDTALDQALAEIGTSLPEGERFCVERDESVSTHSEVDVDVPLAPRMGYLVDIECVPASAPATARGPRVLRRHLTTGAFSTMAELAWSVSSTLPRSRSVAPGTFSGLWTTLGARPQGAQVDSWLMDREVEPLGPPEYPRVVVFWEQSGSGLPQPAAVMIDATEPLSRWRDYPFEETDATVQDHPRRWVLRPREWLHVAAGGDAGMVRGISYVPGAQRVFVVLNPGQRGRHLTADLVAPEFADLPFLGLTEQRAPLLDLTFTRAPWEES